MRQEIGRLIHQVDPELLVFDRGVDMHAADQHAIGERPKIRDQPVIAVVLDPMLILAAGKRMGRGRHHRHAEVLRDFSDTQPQFAQLMPDLTDVLANRCADFDL